MLASKLTKPILMLVWSSRELYPDENHVLTANTDTRLADRTAAQAVEARQPPAISSPALPPDAAATKDRSRTPTKGKPTSAKEVDQTPASDLLSALRADLAVTQKARTSLQSQVEELTASLSTLDAQNKTSSTHITQLTRAKTEAERRLRDLEEELRGKDRLVEQAQDEMVAQGLQMNMAEQRAEKLEKENKELVDRWMKRMGEEADRVNRDSKWE